MVRPRWWKGSRGEWYVVAQFALFLLIAIAPRVSPAQPVWGYPIDTIALLLGGVLIFTGMIFAVAGFISLGANLTILPRPKKKGNLVVTGAYRLVRHPIYSGVFCVAFGWGIWNRNFLLMGYAILLFLVMDIKARREERWLMAKYPDYEGYRKRVKRLIPYIY